MAYFSCERPAGTTIPLYEDMLEQFHLMIAGATGSGKSVLVNGLIYETLYRFPGDNIGASFKQAQFILIDPKRVELVQYKNLPHTLKYASEPNDMINALQYAMNLIDYRYKLMSQRGQRKYQGSDIYVIIDEFADLMTTNKKQVSPLVQRICQVGRAAKVHMILCTQCPISKVIPTEIKVNFDARVGLRTRSEQDSRNILGFTGCEALPRYGKAIYSTSDVLGPCTITMISDDELAARVEHWERQFRGVKW